MTRPLILCNLILILLGMITPWPSAPPTAPAKAVDGMIYYVAPTGNDDYPGNLAYPWRTIQKAAETLVAGDTVYIRVGVYAEQVVPQNSGSAGQPITYTVYPGETAIIDGSSINVSPNAPGLIISVFNVYQPFYILSLAPIL